MKIGEFRLDFQFDNQSFLHEHAAGYVSTGAA